MLDPEYLANVSEGAEEIASELHTNIIKQVVRHITYRLGQGENFSLTQTDRYQLEILQEAGYLLKDILKEIAKKTRTQEAEVKAAFEDSGVRSMRSEASIYERAGISTEPLLESPTLIRILQRGYEATMQEWSNYTRTTAISAQQLFISECNRAYNRVVAGETTFSGAYYDAIKKVSEGGIVVQYPKKDAQGNPIPGTVGWTDTIEVATSRAVRTGIAQATSDMTATRAAENGVTCFLVSKHQGARPTHAVWQGQVYWIDWDILATRVALPKMDSYPQATLEEKVKYKEFCTTTGVGEMLGLCGINCRHSYSPFFDGISHNPYPDLNIDEDPEIYENTQKQRLLERRIRKTKRELVTLLDAQKTTLDEEAKSKLDKDIANKDALLTAQNAEYRKFCKEHDLRPQEKRLAIAGWNREVVQSIEQSSLNVYKEQLRIDNREYFSTNTSDVIKEINKGKHNSLERYLDEDGKLVPKREEHHKEIIDQTLAGKQPVNGQATMTMLGGGPASGKSSVMSTKNVDNHTVVVNPDDMKEKLDGYKRMAKRTDKAAAYYHEESSALAKRLSQVSYSENYNVIYDGTGDGSISSVQKKINQAKANGYNVEAKYVTIDTEEAVRRNQKRYDDAIAAGETPRLPPEDYVRECHAAVTDISVQVAPEFNRIEIWDNNGAKGEQKLIAVGGNGQYLKAVEGEEKALLRYLAKGANGLESFIILPDGQVVPKEPL